MHFHENNILCKYENCFWNLDFKIAVNFSVFNELDWVLFFTSSIIIKLKKIDQIF